MSEPLPTVVDRVDVSVPDGQGVADAYLARPDGSGRWPGVLMMMDAFGLRPRLEEMAARLAAQGYVVLVPNLYHRAGRSPVVDLPDLTDPAARGEVFGAIRPLMADLTPERMRSDGRAYVDHLAGRDDVADSPLGLTGYCMGVGHAMRVAAEVGDRVGALGGFHGARLATDDEASPHLLAGELSCALLFGHADHDDSNPPEQQQALAWALREAGLEVSADVYEGADHGFTMSDTAAYDVEATERHWRELESLFARTLR